MESRNYRHFTHPNSSHPRQSLFRYFLLYFNSAWCAAIRTPQLCPVKQYLSAVCNKSTRNTTPTLFQKRTEFVLVGHVWAKSIFGFTCHATLIAQLKKQIEELTHKDDLDDIERELIKLVASNIQTDGKPARVYGQILSLSPDLVCVYLDNLCDKDYLARFGINGSTYYSLQPSFELIS